MKLSPAVWGATAIAAVSAFANVVGSGRIYLFDSRIGFAIMWVISFVGIKVGASVRRWLGL